MVVVTSLWMFMLVFMVVDPLLDPDGIDDRDVANAGNVGNIGCNTVIE